MIKGGCFALCLFFCDLDCVCRGFFDKDMNKSFISLVKVCDFVSSLNEIIFEVMRIFLNEFWLFDLNFCNKF